VSSLLSTREVAALLGLSPETVLRRFRRGEFAGYRLASNVLRFRAADVDAYLTARREENAARSSGEEVNP
jgi:excisionase family DNA binding protein